MRNIIEQGSQWQKQLYISFVNFEKAFGSVHRESMCLVLRSYEILQYFAQLIQSFHSNFSCSVGGNDIWFEVKTGVRQSCVMSALLFNLTIDWVMRCTTEAKTKGIKWTHFFTLNDLDFANDRALISYTHCHTQDKTDKLFSIDQQVGLKISQKKTEVMTINVLSPTPVQLDKHDLCSTDQFTYFGSILIIYGGAEKDIKSRLKKVRNAFRSMMTLWKFSQYTVNTKVKLYKTCILSVLLY